MKNIIIIGARGYGREYYQSSSQHSDYGKAFTIKGFLDDKSDALNGFDGYPPILSSVEDYIVQADDVFVCALGNSYARAKYIDIIRKKNGKFHSSIHPTAIICDGVELGEGITISQFCTISANVKIGDFTTVQAYSTFGHDAQIGKFCSIEAYTFLGGFAQIGNYVTLHTRATILPHIKVGDNSIVGAGSVVIKNVKENITVFGNPAKKIEF